MLPPELQGVRPSRLPTSAVHAGASRAASREREPTDYDPAVVRDGRASARRRGFSRGPAGKYTPSYNNSVQRAFMRPLRPPVTAVRSPGRTGVRYRGHSSRGSPHYRSLAPLPPLPAVDIGRFMPPACPFGSRLPRGSSVSSARCRTPVCRGFLTRQSVLRGNVVDETGGIRVRGNRTRRAHTRANATGRTRREQHG